MKQFTIHQLTATGIVRTAIIGAFATFGWAGAWATTRADQAESAAANPVESDASRQDAKFAEAAAATPSAPAMDSGVLYAWIAQLDDDRYAVRESAQKQLTAAGTPALEATATVAATGSLESSTRAVGILLAWADSKDSVLSLAALERLAALETRPAEAAMAFERLAAVRELAAIEAIRNLGGRVDVDRSFGMVVGANSPLQIFIGPKWKGGAEGLQHVAAVRSATTLSLHSAPLDDQALPQLTALTNVRRIELYGTGMSQEGVDNIQDKLPNTMFDVRRSGARLGIRGLDVQEVVRNSPAEKAGLVVGDRITEFAGAPIDTFEQLTGEIAKCQPGDSAAIKVLRAGLTIDKTVTFDRWGDDAGQAEPPVNPPANAQGLFGPIPGGAPGRIIIRKAR